MNNPAKPDALTSVELSVLINPRFWQAIEVVQHIAGYDVPAPHKDALLRFHTFTTSPQPEYISSWRADPKLEKWYHRHVGGMFGDLQSALAAAHYHKDNLGKIETDLIAALLEVGLVDHLGMATVGISGTQKLDFEYQAFVLACRRALDYLSVGLAAYFKTEASSFRTLPKAINAGKPTSVREAIINAHRRHVVDLDYIMAEGRRSVRNRIAHYEFVPAGVINVGQGRIMLLGGGEELGLKNGRPATPLGEALKIRLERLHACVVDMIDSFVTAVRAATSDADHSAS